MVSCEGYLTRIPLSGGAYAPIIGFDTINPIQERNDISELKFNYRYNKENHKALDNSLILYNLGSLDLIISNITTNYSVTNENTSVVEYPIICSETSVTIPPNSSHKFNFEFNPIKRADALDEDGEIIDSVYVNYKEEISRKIIIESNAVNHTKLTEDNYGLSFENNNAINEREFLTSIWYEETPYSWHPIERNYFMPYRLEPGGINQQKIQITVKCYLK